MNTVVNGRVENDKMTFSAINAVAAALILMCAVVACSHQTAGRIESSSAAPQFVSPARISSAETIASGPVRVTIFTNASVIAVYGQVATQGVFQVTGLITPEQAIELAGGFTDFADRGRVQIVRSDGSKQVVDLNSLAPNGAPLVHPEDRIVVRRTVLER